MNRLYSVTTDDKKQLQTIWAHSPNEALRLTSLVKKHDTKSVVVRDITDEHLDRENPYRSLTLLALNSGRTGVAHLTITSDPNTSGWWIAGSVVNSDYLSRTTTAARFRGQHEFLKRVA